MSQIDPQKQIDDHRTDNRKEQQEHQAAVQMAAEESRRTVKNPQFLDQLQEADLNTDLFDDIQNQIGILASGSNIKGVRDENYAEQQDLLVKNAIERVIAERTPGRLLRENPRMHAIAQGLTGTKACPDPTDHEDYREPVSSAGRRALRHAKDAIVNHQSLSIEGRGIDAVANATVERRSVDQSETEASGVTGRLKGVLR
jgi:hypothetical protein